MKDSVWWKDEETISVSSILIHSTPSSSSVFVGGGNLTTTGNGAVGIGSAALLLVTSGVGNVAVGTSALAVTTDGEYNVGVGYATLSGNIGGDKNTGIGAGALLSVTSGSNNTGIGFEAGDNISTGSNNIVIGRSSDAASATASNQLNIQNIIWGTDNSGTGTTVSTGLIGIGISAPTAKLHLASGTTAAAQLRFAVGVPPSSPNDGDVWYDNTNGRLMWYNTATSREFLGASAVSSVTATLPNRTLTIVFNGTTYYIHAKTTND